MFLILGIVAGAGAELVGGLVATGGLPLGGGISALLTLGFAANYLVWIGADRWRSISR